MEKQGFSLRRDRLGQGEGGSEGGKEVRIVLHDGSSIRYMKRDGTVIDELLEVLKRGVSQAKPAQEDWSELA